MIKIHPKLNSLRQNLRITKLNTGKQFGWQSIVYDDIEALHAITSINGCVHFKSGTEMGMISYRGQPTDYGVCSPTISRCKTDEELFISFCRTVAFEFLLDKHPFVETIKNIKLFDKHHVCINKTGIAQHYGLHTNYLDLTSNFDVASFFASCSWNKNSKRYEPIRNADYLGVIFKIYEFRTPTFEENIQFEYLGWQPFPRPEQQRASIVKLDNGVDFSGMAQKYYFRHSNSASKKIWKKFDEGRLLFPDDSAAELAEQCKNLTKFTAEEIDEAVHRFNDWKHMALTKENLNNIIDANKIIILDNSALGWGTLLETNKEFWEEKFYSVVCRFRFRFRLTLF